MASDRFVYWKKGKPPTREQIQLDVITRRSDWITNSIADTFAKICAQFWQGELEIG